MQLEVFVFDLDGTLLNSKKQLSSLNCQMLRALKAANKIVIIATGRHLSQLHHYDLSQADYIITSNGAGIYQPQTKQIEYIVDPLDPAVVQDVVLWCQECRRELSFSNQAQMYRVYFGRDIFKDIKEPYFFADYQTKVQHQQWSEVKKFTKQPVVRIGIRCEQILRTEIIAKFDQKYPNHPTCVVGQSSNAYVEFDTMGANKLIALNKVLEKLNQSLKKVCSFGDSENDVVIFKHIKHSVAMGNADIQTKQHARYVIGDNNSSGLADFVKALLNA